MRYNSYVAVDKNGQECIYEGYPERDNKLGAWFPAKNVCGDGSYNDPCYIELPDGSIEKLIGRKLTWEDNAVELT